MYQKLVTIVVILLALASLKAQISNQWTDQQAQIWYQQQPWYVGSNFIPSTAINQLEMWQVETFDTATISRELGWASSIGMNSARVFLHDLLYQQDSIGFLNRMDVFLTIANRHGIKIMFVFFDSVWDPFPSLGKQRDPLPGVHNSGWVQSPGKWALLDSSQYPRLEAYVKGVIHRFANDNRVFCWDLWNEPDNMNGEPYRSKEPALKVALVTNLMSKVFEWARGEHPSQPLTACIWDVSASNDKWVRELQRVEVENSDIITFHNYGDAASFQMLANSLKKFNKPMICTEFMARGAGSTFDAILPLAKKMNIGAMCWGLVNGKTNTIHDWGTWQKPNNEEPKLWHHDVFRKDGRPYSAEEVKLIRAITQ
jgi:hypothetical protein